MRVVAALLEQEGRYAFILRSNPPFEGRLGLIGGRVEDQEDYDEAIVREIHEETGCQASAERIGTITIHYEGYGSSIHALYRAHTSDAPRTTEPSEGEIVLFTDHEVLSHPKLHAFTKRVVELLIAGEPFTGSASIGPGPEYPIDDFTLETR